jgi:hypothetical protein
MNLTEGVGNPYQTQTDSRTANFGSGTHIFRRNWHVRGLAQSPYDKAHRCKTYFDTSPIIDARRFFLGPEVAFSVVNVAVIVFPS